MPVWRIISFFNKKKIMQHLDHELTPDSKKKLPYMAKLAVPSMLRTDGQ